MFINNIILLYGFLALGIIVLFLIIRRMAKIRFWIKVSPKQGSPMMEIGYLEMSDDGAAGEVKLPGGGGQPPIGRVIANEQSKVNHGAVEVITSDLEEESAKPRYMQCGYICFDNDTEVDEYGFIYKQIKGKKKKELLGYCARPSAPNVPTLVGERSWKTLWLVKTLHAYSGRPTPEKVEEKENSPKENVKGIHYLVGINAKKNSTPVSQNENQESVELVQEEQQVQEVTQELEDPQVQEASQEQEESQAPEDSTSKESDAQEDTTPEVEEKDEPQEENPEKDNKEEKEEEGKEEDKEEKEDKKASKKKDKKAKKEQKQPLAVVKSYGFHFNSNKYLPAEARACAYALLSRMGQKRKHSEFYKANPYGWADTALLTSVIYSILFLALYTVNTGILQLPLLGEDLLAVLILTACYPMLWALVRLVKISSIENSNSIQSKLDMLNKTLRLNGQNYAIILMSLIAFYCTLDYYDFDFIPLIVAILIGVIVNMCNKNAKRNWIICSSYNENEEEILDEEEVINPPGDISRTYEWSLDRTYSSQELNGSITLYFSANEMHNIRQCNPFFFQRKDKSDKEYISEMFDLQVSHKSAFLARVRYIANYINRTISEHNLTPLDKIQFTLDFIQEPNIKFVNNVECKEVNYYEDYIRFPDECLFDKMGDCNSKSLLAAMLFHVMGYNVLYLASRKFNHAAIGIEISPRDLAGGWYGGEKKTKDMVIVDDNRSYIYCETTGDRFSIGRTIDGMTLADFEEKVLLPATMLEEDEENDDATESRIYNWDLHPENGVSKLHGNLTIEFNSSEISILREENPFRSYGKDANTYEMNIEKIFSYVFAEPERNERARLVADYIRKTIESNGLSELDKIQFALDFVQTPNIAYCVDDDSASISFAKEYMRYPDEVLYDKEGDCDCKCSLAVAILHELGYNVVMMLSKKLGHAAIAVECKEEWLEQLAISEPEKVVREYNNRNYIYCETTGDGNKVGDIKEGENIQDFESLVEVLV